MPELNPYGLRRTMLRGVITRCHVHQTVNERREHFHDLQQQALAAGDMTRMALTLALTVIASVAHRPAARQAAF